MKAIINMRDKRKAKKVSGEIKYAVVEFEEGKGYTEHEDWFFYELRNAKEWLRYVVSENKNDKIVYSIWANVYDKDGNWESDYFVESL